MGSFEDKVNARYKASLVNTPEFPRLYVEYLSAKENISLQEAARRSLARLWNIFQDIRRNAAIITAFRGDIDVPDFADRAQRFLAANRARNRQLMNDVRKLGYGFSPVIGGFIEKDQDTGKRIRAVEEEALVVSGPIVESTFQDAPVEAPAVAEAEHFKADMLTLVRRYNQESALLKVSGSSGVFLLNSSGSTHNMGKWQLNKAAEFYTVLRAGGQRLKKWEWLWEAAGDETRSVRMAVRAFFEHKASLA